MLIYSSFSLRLIGQKLLSLCCQKVSLLVNDHMFHIVQKSQNFNHQFHCGHRKNGECENVSEELFGIYIYLYS